MRMITGVTVFGDSLMKATAPDERQRLHFNIRRYAERLFTDFSLPLTCKAQFGATVSMGCRELKKALSKGIEGSHVLIEYGGNDCDFDWAAIAENPQGQHVPRTPLPQFRAALAEMVELVQQAGKYPVLMSLPPIDAERYLQGMKKRGLNRANIVAWLGDPQMIYRYHELYSMNVVNFARSMSLPLIDIRNHFLERHDFSQLLSADGIHPSLKGYDFIYEICAAHLRNLKNVAAV